MIIGKLGKHKPKAIGAVVTLAVLVLLVLAGPAEALTIYFSGLTDKPVLKGNIVTFTGKIKINSEEVLNNLTQAQLNLDGPGDNDRICTFRIDGTEISVCEGINITLREQTAYGYGYGYGYGFTNGLLIYTISINTTGFKPGSYHLQLLAGGTGSDKRLLVVAEGPKDEKVTICHTPPGNPAGKETIKVSSSAVAAHLAHGDYLGQCRTENGNNEKVTICHIPPGNPNARDTIRVAQSAVHAHLEHGDTLGQCQESDNGEE